MSQGEDYYEDEDDSSLAPYRCIRVEDNGMTAILCDSDSILQTWYNKKHTFTKVPTHVVVGCFGVLVTVEPRKVKWFRGVEGVFNTMDIDDDEGGGKVIIRNKKKEVVLLHLYTWLEDDNGLVYDVPRPEWTEEKRCTIINGVSKEVLEATKGCVYKQYGKELEQTYLKDQLDMIYGGSEFTDQSPPDFHD